MPRYRLDPGGEELEPEEVVALVRDGRLDLGRRLVSPAGRVLPLEEHPELLDLALEEPGRVRAPEFRQRLDEGQCLHCHHKGAAPYRRRRVAGFLVWTRSGCWHDFACPSCRGRAVRGDLASTAWLGWWGLPAAVRAPGAIAAGLRSLVGRGDGRGVAAGLVGLAIALSPVLVGAPVVALALRPPEPVLSDRDVAEREVEEGSRRLELREYGAAAMRYEAAVRVDPDWYVPHFLLAMARFGMGDHRGALEAIRAADRRAGDQEVDPEHRRRILDLRTQLAERAGETAEAAEVCRRLVAASPEQVALHLRLERLLVADGRRDEAIAEYRARVEARGEAATADDHFLVANVLVEPEAALVSLSAALARDPRHARALVESADRLIALGRDEEALDAIRRSQEVEVRPRSYELEATALLRLGRAPEAVRSLAAAVEKAPNELGLHRRLAEVRRWTGAFDEASRVLGVARRLAGTDPVAGAVVDFDRGLLAREAGRFDEAAALLATVRSREGLPESRAADASLEFARNEGERGGPLPVADPAPDPVRRLRVELWLGVLEVEAGDVPAARARWRRAVLADPAVEPGEDPSPAAELRYLLQGDPDPAAADALREATWTTEQPTLANNVEFVIGLARFLAGDEAGAHERFEAAVASSWGRNFPYWTALRWAERTR